MQQNDNANRVQTAIDKRMLNTDPREVSSEAALHAKLSVPQPRRLSAGSKLALCLLALALSLSILGLTGGLAFSSVQKNLPTRAFTINGHGSLVINDRSGTFHIHESTGNQLIVRGSEYAFGLVSSLNSMQAQYKQQGNTVTLDANEGWSLFGNSGMTFDITVPANLDVTIHGWSTDADLTGIDGQVDADSSSGNLHLNGISGALQLSTSSGNIVVTDARSEVSAHTSSGDIGVTGAQGEVNAHTSSGNIDIHQLNGPVNLSTSSGNITLEQASISGQDQLQTSSGNINFSGTLDPHGTYQMSASSGDITLNLPASSAFLLSTSTSSGDIDNAFSTPSTGSAPYATLTLKTSSGNITLHKQ